MYGCSMAQKVNKILYGKINRPIGKKVNVYLVKFFEIPHSLI